jgi:thiopurine S-methyltransferase
MKKSIYNTAAEEKFWTQRYESGSTGWNIGYASPPITAYFDQVLDKSVRILIPGAGNAYEAEYLYRQGFENVFVLDIAQPPLEALKKRFPEFPQQQLLHGNFFEHQGQYDYVVEQTFFCSFPPLPDNRRTYAQRMHELLQPGGKLVGLWFKFPLNREQQQPPYGGSREEYLTYFEPLFEVHTFEESYNSIEPRQGNELFGILLRNEE